VENGGFLADYPEFLEKMREDGVKIISLAWNGESPLAGGCHSEAPLSDKAIEIIRKMNDYGMALDISHLNESSAKKAIEISKFPMATHSNCKRVFNHPRNLSDEILLSLKKKGGIVGLCFYPEFLGGDVFFKLYANVTHLLSLEMAKNIAIGSDFDGAEMDSRLSKTENVKELYRFLINKGIEKHIVDGIFFENALAFFRKICNNY
jgi:membrane dipeptidase